MLWLLRLPEFLLWSRRAAGQSRGYGACQSQSGWGVKRLTARFCTRQGSNLQPYDPKSYTLSN
jgi:hypothetical protein